MPTHKSKNSAPNPEKNEATRETRSSLNSERELLVVVTSYTKNQAVKNTPIPSRTTVRWGNIAGLIGDTYLDIDSISIA